MFLYFDKVRNASFGRAPVIVPQTGGDVADPRGDDFPNTAGADQLVELYVGDRSDQGQIPFLLTNDLMTRGEGDQRFERTAHGNRSAILDVESDRILDCASRADMPLCI